MTVRRTNKGANIDMDALISQSSKHSPAVGNMRVNAKGDVLGANGEIVKTNEQRVRDHYQAHPSASTNSASLKGKKPTPDTESAPAAGAPKTAKTQEENQRTQSQPHTAEEPEEFEPVQGVEPVGYKEIELPNGDIEMVPVYKDTDS